MRDVTSLVLGRPSKQCAFVEYKDKKIVYKRYASLFFVAGIGGAESEEESNQRGAENELITLEKIHLFVEILDRYFGNVCELDIIFNFHRAYYILDELMIGGYLQETSKKEVLKSCSTMDDMMDDQEGKEGANRRKSGAR